MDDKNKTPVKSESPNEKAKTEKNTEQKEVKETKEIKEFKGKTTKRNSEIKRRDIENTINAMLDQVMMDPDETNSNSNQIRNSLQFNDDESNEEDISELKYSPHFLRPNFDRGNKRLKTVVNFPVNIPNMPIMNINPYNYGNYFTTMRAPSFEYFNINNDNNSMINSHINNLNNNNCLGHKSSNNLFNGCYLDNSSNNLIHNNINNANFLRSTNPYSKTVIYHYPLSFLNNNFNFYPQNFKNFQTNLQNKNFQENNNNNKINTNSNNNTAEKEKGYQRKESRRKTYPSFYNEDNPQESKDNPNSNNCPIAPGYNNQMIYQNQNNYNTTNNNEYFILQLKITLEKATKIDHYIYGLIKGKFLNIIKNHKGSKIFQKYLKSTHSDILHQIFVELNQNLEELITDPYANYFCKKFFTYLNQKDRIDFLKGIEKSIVKLSSDSIGTYPIQTIIEHVGSKNEKIIIINALKNSIKELAVDPFGSHVLEKLLTCFEEEYVSFIYTYIVDNFLDLANNSNGICVVKKILTFTHKKSMHDKLKAIIKENGLQLISHPFANFVIQIVVENWTDCKEILELYYKKFHNLSLEKYASNVVERCIEKDEGILNLYIDEIVGSNRIYEIMRSNYGNYVIQKALKLAKGEYKNKLVFNAAKDINKLNDAKLILKWKSLLSPHINDLSAEQVKYLTEQKFFQSS